MVTHSNMMEELFNKPQRYDSQAEETRAKFLGRRASLADIANFKSKKRASTAGSCAEHVSHTVVEYLA